MYWYVGLYFVIYLELLKQSCFRLSRNLSNVSSRRFFSALSSESKDCVIRHWEDLCDKPSKSISAEYVLSSVLPGHWYTYLFFCVERGTVRAKCFFQENSPMTPYRAQNC